MVINIYLIRTNNPLNHQDFLINIHNFASPSTGNRKHYLLFIIQLVATKLINPTNTIDRVHKYALKATQINVSIILIYFATIVSNFAFTTFLNIKHAHLHHGLLKVQEKHCLVQGITIDSCSGSCIRQQSLVRK